MSNSKLFTVTLALSQILIENIDQLEETVRFKHKVKPAGKHFRNALMLQNEQLFRDLTPERQLVFFQEIEVLETIIREYQKGNLKVIEESELNIQTL